MITREQLSTIRWKQPKYIIPAIIYVPLLATGYFIIDLFYTKPAEIENSSLQSTEYLNPELPQAQIQNDGIGGKYESMVKSYGKIQDYSAVENIDRDNNENDKEEYNSKYSDEDLAFLDQEAANRTAELERLAEMQERLRQSAEKGQAMTDDTANQPMSEAERLAASDKRQQDALAELNKALAEARLKGQKGMEDVANATAETSASTSAKVEVNENAVNELSDDDTAGAVVKKIRTNSDYFNTLADNESEAKMIKAIIDENITAVDGSRVRLRLLDDVEINEVVLPKGSYIYATMSGFGSQRVKGSIKSLMVDDELVKVSLSIYDTDGLEGLYVPSSSFRETGQDIASSALSSNVSMNNSSYNNSFSQWGMQAIQNAYQRTTNAISKAVKKNKAKLKYGTFVYLVNAKDTKNK
jgi:conjugative transposon TraM protein